MSLERTYPLPASIISMDGKNAFIKNPFPAAGKEVGIVLFVQEDMRNPTPGKSAIAKILHQNKLGTLLVDMTENIHTESSAAAKLANTARRICRKSSLPIGYFATGAGAKTALRAAAHFPDLASALVVQGGDLDQAADFLPLIKAPVLLIAAGRDPCGIRSCQQALTHLNQKSAVNVISTATRAFQEPGAMEEAAQLAALWFLQHLE